MINKRKTFSRFLSVTLLTGLSLFICLAVNGQQDKTMKEFKVVLPDKLIPFPTPLETGKNPGFKIRGMKGYNWTPEQYLEEIPFLAKYKANFLMNCYLSMFSVKVKPVYKYGTFLDSIENNWWLPLPEEKQQAYEEIFKSCRKYDINFCFSINPQLFSVHPLNPESDSDFNMLLAHYLWAQQKGVKWFSVCLDDINESEVAISAGQHASLVNRLYSVLKKNDPDAKMIFCPTWYWGDGTDPIHHLYLETLATNLNSEVYIFWTGPFVVPKHISFKDARTFHDVVKHRMILWENYPVNDNHATMHLGPITGRDKDLAKIIDGYMVNPMGTQSHIDRIPLLTCLDYAFNPDAYDPLRSIGQAVLQLAHNPEQELVLARLVETYPGELIFKKDNSEAGIVGLNPVRERFVSMCSSGKSIRDADGYITSLEELCGKLAKLFPGQFPDAVATINKDIIWMKQNNK
jgi:hypothetical protein